MAITAFYAAPLALLFLTLSRNVILARRSAQIAVGDGGDSRLLRAMRVQANSSEYIPIALVLMGLCESLAVPDLILHLLGISLLAGRLIHAFGVSREPENFRFRIAGMAMTLTMIGTAAALAFGAALMQWFG